ncbi:MAG: hypothetical protein ACTSWP_11165 [Candidatus Freyarchaeota archaeon]|nr:hypothetical protein [Candidatus Freyrarchaeum guaymaensis]
MDKHGFTPAFEGEKIVFGAQRPGYPSRTVNDSKVKEWIRFMKSRGIKRVVCLLPPEQLEYYLSPLLNVYRREFGEEKVLWSPIRDFHLCSKEALVKILLFLEDSRRKKGKSCSSLLWWNR